MLGETIKKMRLEQGLSCYELAKRSGHPVSSVYGIENGDNKNPRFEILCDIADVLNVSIEDFKKSFKNKKSGAGATRCRTYMRVRVSYDSATLPTLTEKQNE